MKASELINYLQQALSQKGDIDVVIQVDEFETTADIEVCKIVGLYIVKYVEYYDFTNPSCGSSAIVLDCSLV